MKVFDRLVRGLGSLRSGNGRQRFTLDFQQIVERLGEGVLVTDLDETVLYANPTLARMTGYATGEMIGHRACDLLCTSAADAARMQQRTAQRRDGATGCYETELRRKDGSTFWVEIHGSPYRDASGTVVGTVGALTDIDQRRAAAEALRQSERHYRTFFEDDLTGDYLSTAEGRILDCNPAFAAIFGFASVDEVLHADAFSLHPQRSQRASFLDAVRCEGRVVRHQWVGRRRDGTAVHLIENATALFDPAGELVGIRGYLFDVTEHRKTEQLLHQAQKMQALGRLAGAIAHDFNNLLVAVSGYGELLREALGDEHPARDDVEQILHAAERAAGLTRQLLAFARPTAATTGVIDLNAAVRGMAEMLRRLIGSDSSLDLALGDEPALVSADPDQLQQVLLNLVVNARDAMLPGGGRIRVSVRPEPAEQQPAARAAARPTGGAMVVLEVHDEGCGIPAEQHARIFEPFFTTKRETGGTGLGLSTVYGIVQQSGGEVRIESAPGDTTFRVLLPAVQGQVTPATDAVVGDQRTHGAETILLAEDDPTVRVLMREILRKHGYTVLDAADGCTAMELLAENGKEPDLVITDLVMPVCGGRELARQARERHPTTKVLYLSGYTQEALASRGLLEPGGIFLAKPFTPQSLLRKVREVLADASLR